MAPLPAIESNADMFKHLKPGFVFTGKSGKKFVVESKIGEGGMGAVYKAVDMDTQKPYAIKCEKYKRQRLLQNKGLRLAMEKMIMKTCQPSAHIPEYKDAGRTDTFGWIAMELVGPSLGSLRKEMPDKKFSVVTCLKIAVQVVKGLRDLHNKGFVHRDLKPDNLAIGRGDKHTKIFLLDTGIARQFKNVAGVPHRPRLQVKFKGTRHYAPLALQTRQEYGPKDDLESMFYIIALLHVGELPWSSFRLDDEIIAAKRRCRDQPESIFKDTELCPLMKRLWKYVINLSYEDAVDYNFLIVAITTALTGLSNGSEPFDWDKRSDERNIATAIPRTTMKPNNPPPGSSAKNVQTAQKIQSTKGIDPRLTIDPRLQKKK